MSTDAVLVVVALAAAVVGLLAQEFAHVALALITVVLVAFLVLRFL